MKSGNLYKDPARISLRLPLSVTITNPGIRLKIPSDFADSLTSETKVSSKSEKIAQQGKFGNHTRLVFLLFILAEMKRLWPVHQHKDPARTPFTLTL